MSKLCVCALLLLQPCRGEVVPDEEGAVSDRPLLNARRLGACSTLQKGSWGDITGWHCDMGGTGGASRSLYCGCHNKFKHSDKDGKHKTKIKWTCEKREEQLCTFGSPACVNGRCKDESAACGVTWAASLQQTCAQLITDPTDLAACQKHIGTGPVCPASVLGNDYKSWMNKMKSGPQTNGMLRAAAMDIIWYYRKLPTMVEIAANKTNVTVPAALLTTEISKNLAVWQKFSCMRNVPQCSMDRPATGGCESSCIAVTNAITAWSTACNATAEAVAKKITCKPLGYVRDCDGTKAAEAGDFPRLCSAFQQNVAGQIASGTMQIKALSAMLMVLASWTL